MSAAVPLAMTREQSVEERIKSRGYDLTRVPGVGSVTRLSRIGLSVPMSRDELARFLRGLEFGLAEGQAITLAIDEEKHWCGCGEPHPFFAGGALIGEQDDGQGGRIALFNCLRCGNTRTVPAATQTTATSNDRKRPHLRYVVGDATKPQGTGPRVIVHCCNDVGAWGAGFVLAISRRWRKPEDHYRSIPSGQLALGTVDFVKVESSGGGLWVANLIGQTGCGHDAHGVPPIRYHAIAEGLGVVREWCRARGATVHMPRMGAGLAGGDWTRIERIIVEELTMFGFDVTVYDLPQR